MKFKKLTVLAVTAAAVLSLCACGSKPTEQSGDRAVFTIGDATISESEFKAFVSMYMQNGSYSLDSAKEFAKEDATNNLASNVLFELEGLSYTDEEIKAKKEQKEKIIENLGGEKGYKEYLDTLGVKDSFLDNLLDAQYAQDKLFEKELSEDAKKQYIKDNYLRAKHILLATMDTSTQTKYDDAKIAEQKKLADELSARAKGGEDFDALMNEYSEDPGSKSNPDGYFFTTGEMVQEFESTVRSLGMNEIGLCESDYGYHIIKRLPLDDDAALFDEQYSSLEPTVAQILLQNTVKSKIPELLEKHGLKIETNEEVYNSITA